jgi:hypothetical protein
MDASPRRALSPAILILLPYFTRFPTRCITPAASRNPQCAQDGSSKAPAALAIVADRIDTSR